MVNTTEARANIACNVRFFIRKRGITQSELARLSGENRMFISRVCNDKTLPNAASLARIAESLGVTSERLMENPQ